MFDVGCCWWCSDCNTVVMHGWVPGNNQARAHMRGLHIGEGWWREVGVRITDCIRRWMPYRQNTTPFINQWPLCQSTLTPRDLLITTQPWTECSTVWGDTFWPFGLCFNLHYILSILLITHVILFRIKHPSATSEEPEAITSQCKQKLSCKHY